MPNIMKRLKYAASAAGVAYKSAFNSGDWISSDRPGNIYSSGNYNRDWNPGTALNYGALAGELWHNSACQAVLNWIIRAWPESYPCVKKKVGDEKVIVKDHPLVDILLNPNEYDDDTVLWAGTIISFWCDGNAYWRINRTRGGAIGEFEYVPHWSISPYRTPGSMSRMPEYYNLNYHGKRLEIPVYDIVHFKFGIDPHNDLLGMSAWASVAREVYTDNEAVNYTATTLRNRGSAWMIVSPKDADAVFEDGDRVKKKIIDGTTGDNRGGVIIMDGSVDVNLPAPMNENGLFNIRKIPETRICALAGIPGMAVGLAAHLERSTFANTEQAEGAAWNTIVAVQRMLGRQLTKQVLWRKENYNQPVNSIFAGFDYSEVRALQPDTAGEWERIGEAYDRGLVDTTEARADMGLEPFTSAQQAEVTGRLQAMKPVSPLAGNKPGTTATPAKSDETDDEEPPAGITVKTPDDIPPKSGGDAEDLPVENKQLDLGIRIRKQIGEMWQTA